MSANVWQECLALLKEEYPGQQYHTWLRPLQAETNDTTLVLLAPNHFVVQWVQKHFYSRIKELVTQLSADTIKSVSIEIGSKVAAPVEVSELSKNESAMIKTSPKKTADHYKNSYLNKKLLFDSFVEGNSNQLARAASLQVAERPGDAYNPLFIYGGVG